MKHLYMRRRQFLTLATVLLATACDGDDKRELEKIAEKAKEQIAAEVKKQAEAKV